MTQDKEDNEDAEGNERTVERLERLALKSEIVQRAVKILVGIATLAVMLLQVI